MSLNIRIDTHSDQQNHIFSCNEDKGCLSYLRKTASRISAAFDLYLPTLLDRVAVSANELGKPLKKPTHPLPDGIIGFWGKQNEKLLARIEKSPGYALLTEEQSTYFWEKWFREGLYRSLINGPSLEENRQFLKEKYAFLIQES